MSVEAALFARLSSWPALSALVGARVYPAPAPQGVVVPYVVYELREAERYSAFDGDIPVVDSAYRIESFGSTRLQANAVRDAVRGALQRWKSSGPPQIIDSYTPSEGDGPFDRVSGVYRADLSARLWSMS